MADQEQSRKIKCPHCGWIRTIPATVVEDESQASIAAGPGDTIRDIFSRIKEALITPPRNQADTWIDIPECPNCHNVYQYNPYTGVTRK